MFPFDDVTRYDMRDKTEDCVIPAVGLFSPAQNGRHFADDIFKSIFMNEKFCIFIGISLKFVPKGPIVNKSALVQVMAWRRTGDKPLPEPMMTQFIVAYRWY